MGKKCKKKKADSGRKRPKSSNKRARISIIIDFPVEDSKRKISEFDNEKFNALMEKWLKSQPKLIL